MNFQRKLDRLCAMLDVGDACVLRTLLARVSDATDLEDPLQWFHVLRGLLGTYAALWLGCAVETRAPLRRYKAAIAAGLRAWFVAERPLRVAAAGREGCVDRLMLVMAEELRRQPDLLEEADGFARRTAEIFEAD